MIDKNQAKQLAEEKLASYETHGEGLEPVILDEVTEEEEFGWVFFYNSKLYLETGEVQYALVGNAPLIVDKRDGSVHETGTVHEIEYYIENYRRTGSPY